MQKRGGDFCAVPGCSNQRLQTKAAQRNVSYFRFPTNLERRRQWILAVRRNTETGSSWAPKGWERICSDHFPGGVKTDEPGSHGYVPSLMPWTKSHRPRLTRTSNGIIISPQRRKFICSRKIKVFTPVSTRRGRPRAVVTVVTPHVNNHDYLKTDKSPSETVTMMKAESSIPGVIAMLQNRELLLSRLAILERDELSIENLKADNKKMQFWTGFPNCCMFRAVFNFLSYKASHLKYWRGARTVCNQHYRHTSRNKPGIDRKLTLEEEFLLTMVRLKTNTMITALALHFHVCESTVTSVFTTWINFMMAELKLYFELPDADVLKSNKSKAFVNFPSAHIVVDCTEIFTETPSDMLEKKHMFSNYKNHQTFKFLIGISAHPAVVFVSRMYGGKASDMLITTESTDMLTSVNLSGGQIMADRGFTGTYKTKPVGAEFITPVFKGRSRSQLPVDEIKQSEQCSKARIHVERVIQRIKCYHILDGSIKMSMRHVAEQIFTVCAYLTNFQNPILKE